MKFRVLSIDTTRINHRGVATEKVLTLDRRGVFHVGEQASIVLAGGREPEHVVVIRTEGRRVWIELPVEVPFV